MHDLRFHQRLFLTGPPDRNEQGRDHRSRPFLLWEQIKARAVPLTAMHLQSDAIEAIAYDEHARWLRARFRDSGETVTYEDVPQDVYDSLNFADSIAGFFREHIEGRFPQRRS